METVIKCLIFFHAVAGTIALLGGLVALLAQKGGKKHKKFGIVFYYAMITSGFSAMFISVLPNHENAFLFAIGIFSIYFVLAGYRTLKFKNQAPTSIDKIISCIMIFAGLGMIFLPIILQQQINIVLAIFGLIGSSFAFRDLVVFRKPELLKQKWLKLHLGKMTGGYISATTAFVVVNQFIPGIYAWFAPGLIGGFYIAFWIRKINKKKES